MGSHLDQDHSGNAERSKILDELRIRSELMSELGKNSHQTANVVRKWNHDKIEVSEKEPDQNGVLRISIGGHPDMTRSEYCNFRGDQSKCIALLERCIKAMKKR